MVFGSYEVIAEHKERVKVIEKLKEIEKKLNVSFYEVHYVMNELDVSDEICKKDLE